MRKLAIIPARGGSKRLPRKNIKPFLGKPVIVYSIIAALESRLFDEVMVSTDDSEIAEVAIQYGATVPFLRSKENSDDFTGPGDVVHEVMMAYRQIGKHFDIGCCLYATAPLVSKEKLKEAYILLENSEFDTIFPVVKFSYPIWRSYIREVTGEIKMNFPEYERMRSQDIMPAYHDAGQFYWFYFATLEKLANKNVFGNNKGSIEIPEMESQDIDTLEDWKIAELKASLINSIEKS